MRDPGKQRTDLVLRELFGQGTAASQEMTRLHRIARQGLLLHDQVLKKVFDRIQTAVDRGRGEVGRMLLLDEGIDLAPRHCTEVLGEWRKKQA